MIAIAPAGAEEAAEVAAALAALSAEAGDVHRADGALVSQGLAAGVVRAMLAREGAAVRGAAVWSPFLSTTRGRIGAFVTDLWVDGACRGQGLGRRLLAGVARDCAQRHGPTFLRLNFFDDNPGAVAFYRRLGFAATPGEVWVTLEGAALEDLG
jgi:ribosomal protein S18 acetylase RimI-like enzyme